MKLETNLGNSSQICSPCSMSRWHRNHVSCSGVKLSAIHVVWKSYSLQKRQNMMQKWN